MSASPQILGDPDWFPHQIDPAAGTIGFVHLPRAAHRAATFLSDENLKHNERRCVLPLQEAGSAGHAAAGPVHFVFHSAFCCSTLLTRALDVPGISMGLKEPAVLNDLAAMKRRGLAGPRLGELIDRLLTLLARPMSPGESTIVKPGNVANCLIDELLAARPEARAVFMYSRLPVFLRSIAKKGLWGRRWARQLYALLQAELPLDTGFAPAEVLIQTDLQVAALAWLMHQSQFAGLLASPGADRIRTLDSETLLAAPTATLMALAGFVDINLASQTATRIAEGAVFRQDSKVHERAYGSSDREAEHARVEEAHGDEIVMVVKWAEAVARHCRVPLTLSNQLLELPAR